MSNAHITQAGTTSGAASILRPMETGATVSGAASITDQVVLKASQLNVYYGDFRAVQEEIGRAHV